MDVTEKVEQQANFPSNSNHVPEPCHRQVSKKQNRKTIFPSPLSPVDRLAAWNLQRGLRRRVPSLPVVLGVSTLWTLTPLQQGGRGLPSAGLSAASGSEIGVDRKDLSLRNRRAGGVLTAPRGRGAGILCPSPGFLGHRLRVFSFLVTDNVLWVELCHPPSSYVEALTPRTSECDLVWEQGRRRGHSPA